MRAREKLCTIECIAGRRLTETAAGIIIALRYYRTWFYYHIMAFRGWLTIVFVSSLVRSFIRSVLLSLVYSSQFTQCMRLFILCARTLGSYTGLQFSRNCVYFAQLILVTQIGSYCIECIFLELFCIYVSVLGLFFFVLLFVCWKHWSRIWLFAIFKLVHF